MSSTERRVFVCEFVTGGGLRDKPLPPSLAREGAMMRDALLTDLRAIGGVTVATTHDDRLPPPEAESHPIGAGDDPWRAWHAIASTCDAAWPVAPETDGALEHLTVLCRAGGARLLSCGPDAVRLATSKLATARRLAACAIPTVPTFAAEAVPAHLPPPWVIKPDDGAGCTDTRLVGDAREITALGGCASPAPTSLSARSEAGRRDAAPPVVQPFIAGTPASLTLLCCKGEAALLTVNRQHVELHAGTFTFHGVTVAAFDGTPELAALASAIVRAVPGLHGIVGVDLVLTDAGPVVIEINPRLTTSYAGLRRTLGANPAALVLAHASYRPAELAGPARRNPVELTLAEAA